MMYLAGPYVVQGASEKEKVEASGEKSDPRILQPAGEPGEQAGMHLWLYSARVTGKRQWTGHCNGVPLPRCASCSGVCRSEEK